MIYGKYNVLTEGFFKQLFSIDKNRNEIQTRLKVIMKLSPFKSAYKTKTNITTGIAFKSNFCDNAEKEILDAISKCKSNQDISLLSVWLGMTSDLLADLYSIYTHGYNTEVTQDFIGIVMKDMNTSKLKSHIDWLHKDAASALKDKKNEILKNGSTYSYYDPKKFNTDPKYLDDGSISADSIMQSKKDEDKKRMQDAQKAYTMNNINMAIWNNK